MTTLFEFQKEGVAFLASRRRALLLDDMGLGKTLQGIRASDELDIDSISTICPASVRTQWRRSYKADAENPAEFNSYSYEYARDKSVDERGVLILDEFHYLKNSTSGRTKKILGQSKYGVDGLVNQAQYVWGFSGTPMPKDASDFYAILHAITPGALATSDGQTMDYWRFVKKFCVLQKGFKGQIVIRGSKNLDELKERIEPYILRRTKKEVFKDWKDPIISELWLENSGLEKELRKLEATPEGLLLADALRDGGMDAVAALTGFVATLRRYIGLLKVAPVVNWLLEQTDCGLNKVVVMCYHREVVESISAELTKNGVSNVKYWGGLTDKQKDAVKADFVNKSEVKVMVGQIDACGTGLDGLQACCSKMLFAEQSWLADQNAQALDRVNRIGQTEPVLAWYVGIEGSLDGKIMQAVRRRDRDKRTLFDNH